jgi:Caspase domain
MNPRTRLTILFDCCHSGSAVELPFVFRPDSHGNVNLIDTVKQGVGLLKAASGLLHGGFSASKMKDAQMLIGGAKTFFNSLQHRDDGPTNEHGLGEEHFVEDWKNEGKDVWMFSGCADDQTSADTSIAGAATGAMSYAFIKTMRSNPQQSYIGVCLPIFHYHLPFIEWEFTQTILGPPKHPPRTVVEILTNPSIVRRRTIRSKPNGLGMRSPSSSPSRHRFSTSNVILRF